MNDWRENIMNFLLNKNILYKLRYENVPGVGTFYVAPVVLLVEGVHSGSAGPILHTKEEFKKYYHLFEGIPVTVGHPQKNGEFVSANTLDILKDYEVGRLFNVSLKENKITGEIFFDVSKVKKFSELERKLKKEEPLEVSVGIFSDNVEEKGVWNNEEYIARATNYKPDHLAILLDVEGACSLKDGCGIRNYSKDKDGGNLEMITVYGIKYNGTESTKWEAPNLSDFDVSSSRWEDLTREERAYVASHFLVGDADAESFSELYYPVVNPKTGKLNENALRAVISGRGRMAKLPNAVKLKAIQQAYRLLNKEFDTDLEVPETLAVMILQKDENNSLEYNISDEIRQIIEKQLGWNNNFTIEAILSTGSIVVEKYDDLLGKSKLLKIPYEIADSGISLNLDKAEEVKRKIVYEVISNDKLSNLVRKNFNKKEGSIMNNQCLESRITSIINNSNGIFSDEDREWLVNLDDKIIEILASRVNSKKVTVNEFSELKKVSTNEFYEKVEKALNFYENTRKKLIDEIIREGSEIGWTEDELSSMEIEVLEKIKSTMKRKNAANDYSLKANSLNKSKNDIEILYPLNVKE